MRSILTAVVLGLALTSCGDNNVGNRTNNMPTITDSANYPIGSGNTDTTPTSNNNAYNPDSAAGSSTTYDTAARRNNGMQP